MKNKTRKQVVEEISKSTGIDNESIDKVLLSFFGVVKTTLLDGEAIQLRQFGTFSRKRRFRKIARDINKGEQIIVEEHDIPYFKPSGEYFASFIREPIGVENDLEYEF